ncbi:MAG: PAS domain S-box protein [Vicinamibacterales bacterium]
MSLALGSAGLAGAALFALGYFAGFRRRRPAARGLTDDDARRLSDRLAAMEASSQAIRASEARWRQVIENEPECLAILDVDGIVRQVNAAGLRMLEAPTAQAVLGRNVADLALPAHRADVRELVDRVFRGESASLEFQIEGLKGSRRWLALHAAPLRDGLGKVESLLGIAHDITGRTHSEALLRWEKGALEQIVRTSSLQDVLDSLMRGLEAQIPEALCSVLLMDDEGRLRNGAAPSLPAEYSAAIDGVRPGPSVGSCGTAVHLNRQVIVEDIASDALWADYRDLALRHGLRACWSTPIRSDEGKVVGTFAVYYRDTRAPNHLERELLDRAESVVAIAIMRKRSEAEARESRERLQMAVDGGGLGVWEWFPQSGKTTHNDQWAALLEYAPHEIVPHVDVFRDLVHPHDLTGVVARLTDHLEGRTPSYRSEHRLRTKRGTWKWVLDRGRVVRRGADGRPVLMSGMVSDVTQLKETEAALRVSQERFEVAVEGSSDGLWDWDMRTNVAYFSPRWKAMIGYADDELTSDYATWEGLIHPEDRPAVLAHVQGYLEGRTPIYSPEFRMRCKDGSYKWILARGAVLRDAQGRPVRMAGSHTDISDRKRAESEISASRRMIEAIIDAIPVRVFWKDRNLNYLGCNAAFASDAGRAGPAEVIGRDDFQMAWRDQAERYRADDRHVIDSGQARLHIEEPQTTPDGQTITLLTSKVPLRNSAGEITGVLGTYLDISERQRAEEEVRRLNARLEDTVRARTAELQQREAQLRDIFDGTSDLIHTLSPGGAILFTNRAWRETLGYDEAELGGLTFWDVVHPDHRDRFRAFRDRLMAGEGDGSVDTVLVGKGGRMCHVEGSVSVGREGGRPVVTRAVLRDVTLRKAMDQALRESEQRHRLMFESSRDALLTIHPPDWRFSSCNPAAVELFGAASDAELCTLGPWAVSPPTQPDGSPSLDRAREAIQIALEQGSHAFEWTHKRLNGPEFPAAVLLSRVVQGGETYVLASARDITEHKRAEASMRSLNENLDRLVTERTGQLRESEERFRSLVDASPNVVLMTASDGRIAFANQRTEAMLGYTAGELIGQPVEILLPAAARTRHVQHCEAFWKAPSTRAMNRGDYLMAHRKDGTDIAVEVGLTPIEMLGGTFVMVTITDVSARKRAEDAVKRLAAFPQVNPNPVMELAPGGETTFVNTSAAALAHDLGLPGPAAMLPANVGAIVRACVEGGQERLGVEQRVGGRVLSWSFYPIAGRGIVHAYASDITDRLALEAKLLQSQKMEAIGLLAGGVAHDFNNILSVMMMQAEVSSTADGVPGETLEGLQEIQACAERGADLTRQLLLFSRRQVMQPRQLDLNEVVTTLTKMLQRIIGEDITLELVLHASRLPARADAGMLDQVLLNLAVNARDAMPKGGRLRVETWQRQVGDDRPHPDLAPGRYVGLSVSDTGCGIAADVLPRIFEPFFTTKEAGKGTGLGLATVFGIVRQHGGWLNVSSEVEQGTTFDIFLPAASGQTAAEAAGARPVVRGGTETVLVAEDERSVRMLISAILERRGYTVIEAASGVEALELWKTHKAAVSLLLTDLVMPDGVSGQDLARQLRIDRPDLRVVFSSGYSAEIAGRELSDDEHFLQKPFTTDVLLQMVREVLDEPVAAR